MWVGVSGSQIRQGRARDSEVDPGQPQAGSFKLRWCRHHVCAGPQSVELFDAAALDNAATERDPDVVVTAVELEAEETVDERGRFATIEAVPLQRFVDPC